MKTNFHTLLKKIKSRHFVINVLNNILVYETVCVVFF